MREYDASADEQREVDLSEEPGEVSAAPTIDPDETVEAEGLPDAPDEERQA